MTYLFPIATTSTAGLVQAGTNIAIDANGIISTTGGSGSATIGNWTPFLDTTGVGVYVIVNRYATYSKIGQQVTCYFDFSVTSLSGGSNSDTLALTGLPFTSATTLGSVGSLYCSYIFGVSGGSYAGTITGTVPSASTRVNLWETDGVSTGLKQESVKALSILSGTITYISAT